VAKRSSANFDIMISLRLEHALILDALDTCADAVGHTFQERLAELKPLVLKHLKRKEAFYEDLAQRCDRRGDTEGAQLVRISETNMQVQTNAVVNFFENLHKPINGVHQAFRTISDVLRARLATEEKKLFPLFEKKL
jgi:hypothetical protein